MTREPGPRLPGSNQVRRFRSVNSRGLWKAGLDLGRHSTILQEASVRPNKCPVGSTSLLPSLITRGVDGAVTGEGVEFTIGAAAATMRDRQEILSPLQTAPPGGRSF